ncbi:MAG TPA: diacylglycerol kinase family protein [Candidatus Dormibacteraeota bacterium]
MAGSGSAGHFWRRCADACAHLGLDVVETTGPGDATALAETAGDRLVIAVGGDGTAHEVVNGLLRRHRTTPPRVGFLQRGTGADLRRSIPGPRRPQEVPAWLTRDQWRPIDAGLLMTASERRFFINVADVGIGAEVVRRAARGPRRAGGTVNFLSAAIVSLLVHRNALIRIRLDEGPWLTRRIRTVAIANGAYLGGAMFIAPRASVDDGAFDVITVGDIGRVKGILSLPLLYRGTHERLAEVEFARAGRVQIQSDEPVGIEADGELAGTTPVTFKMLPNALQVIDWPPSGYTLA